MSPGSTTTTAQECALSSSTAATGVTITGSGAAPSATSSVVTLRVSVVSGYVATCDLVTVAS